MSDTSDKSDTSNTSDKSNTSDTVISVEGIILSSDHNNELDTTIVESAKEANKIMENAKTHGNKIGNFIKLLKERVNISEMKDVKGSLKLYLLTTMSNSLKLFISNQCIDLCNKLIRYKKSKNKTKHTLFPTELKELKTFSKKDIDELFDTINLKIMDEMLTKLIEMEKNGRKREDVIANIKQQKVNIESKDKHSRTHKNDEFDLEIKKLIDENRCVLEDVKTRIVENRIREFMAENYDTFSYPIWKTSMIINNLKQLLNNENRKDPKFDNTFQESIMHKVFVNSNNDLDEIGQNLKIEFQEILKYQEDPIQHDENNSPEIRELDDMLKKIQSNQSHADIDDSKEDLKILMNQIDQLKPKLKEIQLKLDQLEQLNKLTTDSEVDEERQLTMLKIEDAINDFVHFRNALIQNFKVYNIVLITVWRPDYAINTTKVIATHLQEDILLKVLKGNEGWFGTGISITRPISKGVNAVRSGLKGIFKHAHMGSLFSNNSSRHLFKKQTRKKLEIMDDGYKGLKQIINYGGGVEEDEVIMAAFGLILFGLIFTSIPWFPIQILGAIMFYLGIIILSPIIFFGILSLMGSSGGTRKKRKNKKVKRKHKSRNAKRKGSTKRKYKKS